MCNDIDVRRQIVCEEYETQVARIGGFVGWSIGFGSAARKAMVEDRVMSLYNEPIPTLPRVIFRCAASAGVSAMAGALLFSAASQSFVMKKALNNLDKGVEKYKKLFQRSS